MLLFFMQGDQWQLAAFAVVISSILAGCSLTAYYAILVDISTEDERDSRLVTRVGLRLPRWRPAAGDQPGMYLGHDAIGLGEALAVRLSLFSAGVWWAGFTIIPLVRLRNYAPRSTLVESGGLLQRSFGQLVHHARRACAATR